MLIAISGSQGSGKSSLVSELQRDGLPVVARKTSRSILTEWGVTLHDVNNDDELTIKFQNEILRRKWEDERELRESDTIGITERTFMDLFTYVLISIGKNNEHSDWLDGYYAKCAAYSNAYTQVCYLPAGQFTLEHDGVRGSNNYYASLVDNALIHFTRMAIPNDRINIIRSSTILDRKGDIWDVLNFLKTC